jgi:phosphatidylserine/phosphatidylglycerophosphate/cardiolipin synthase-like enzyme
MDYQVCFTPRENCTALIVESLHSAEKSIYVQAYSFTSTAIMRALVDAARRGVDVKVLLDKTQFDNKFYTSGRFFQNNHIPVWVDDKPAIAHNKVIIIDDSTVITGSFNFTKAAQYKNAENLLIIKNNEIAAKYTANWKDRWEQSSQMSSKARHKKDDSEFIKGYKKIMSVIERQF